MNRNFVEINIADVIVRPERPHDRYAICRILPYVSCVYLREDGVGGPSTLSGSGKVELIGSIPLEQLHRQMAQTLDMQEGDASYVELLSSLRSQREQGPVNFHW